MMLSLQHTCSATLKQRQQPFKLRCSASALRSFVEIAVHTMRALISACCACMGPGLMVWPRHLAGYRGRLPACAADATGTVRCHIRRPAWHPEDHMTLMQAFIVNVDDSTCTVAPLHSLCTWSSLCIQAGLVQIGSIPCISRAGSWALCQAIDCLQCNSS